MAKRPTRSQADDASAAPAQAPAKPRARRAAKALGPESVAGLQQPPDMSETFAARSLDTPAEPRPATTIGDADAAQAQSSSPSSAVSMASSPSDEDIRLRAYQIYLERGGEHGLDQEDWIRAERELRGIKA